MIFRMINYIVLRLSLTPTLCYCFVALESVCAAQSLINRVSFAPYLPRLSGVNEYEYMRLLLMLLLPFTFPSVVVDGFLYFVSFYLRSLGSI